MVLCLWMENLLQMARVPFSLDCWTLFKIQFTLLRASSLTHPRPNKTKFGIFLELFLYALIVRFVDDNMWCLCLSFTWFCVLFGTGFWFFVLLYMIYLVRNLMTVVKFSSCFKSLFFEKYPELISWWRWFVYQPSEFFWSSWKTTRV